VVVWSGGVCVCVYVLVYGEGWVGLGVGMRRMTDVCGVVCCVERCGVVMCCVLWLWCVVRVFGAGVWFGCVVGVWCGVGGCCRVGRLVWPMWGSADFPGVLVLGLVVGAVWRTAWHSMWRDVCRGVRCMVFGVLRGVLCRVWCLAWCLGPGVVRCALIGAWCNCGACVCDCVRVVACVV
jgi:hypothetical protein